MEIMNKGIFLLPSLFTMLNMGAGFYSIVATINGRYTVAAWAIIVAIFSDGFDGMIARLTKTTSLLGVEFDSFSDFVSFCIAPVILMYVIVLEHYHFPGLIVGFVYILCGSFRLARFNIMELKGKFNGIPSPSSEPILHFEGLPTPAGAGILASFVLVFELFDKFEQGITKKTIPLLMQQVPILFNLIPILMIIISFIMISKIKYMSIKRFNMIRRVRVQTFILIIVAVLLVFSFPENMVFIIFSMYLLSGLLEYIWQVGELRRKRLLKAK